MIPLLGPSDSFPPVDRALDEPNGLLAAGGGLGISRLTEAYRLGIFPWFSDGDPVLWWCPDPRMVLPTHDVHVSRSLRRRLRQFDYEITLDKAFPQVLEACAAPRRRETGTWLVPSMRRAYTRLFEAGVAHSIEVWVHGSLAGGLYGVALGRMFYGESMFSRVSDASKMAIVALSAHLAHWGFPMIDCQLRTAHLATLGAIDIPRARFVQDVERLVEQEPVGSPWQVNEEIIARLRSPD